MPRIHGYLRLVDKLKPFELPLDALAQQFHQPSERISCSRMARLKKTIRFLPSFLACFSE